MLLDVRVQNGIKVDHSHLNFINLILLFSNGDPSIERMDDNRGFEDHNPNNTLQCQG